MRNPKNKRESGNAIVEFSLVLLPLTIFLVGLIEVARVAWVYQTMASAAKSVTRKAIVKGEQCVNADPQCAQSVAAYIQQLEREGVGLNKGQLTAKLISGDVEKSCAPVTSCAADGAAFPALSDNAIGQPVTVRLTYPVQPVMGLLTGTNATWTLTAASQEVIQF